MGKLIIIRGLPGSGKSTLARQIMDGFKLKDGTYHHFEADQYFISENGDYNFDPSKLKLAHQWCQDQVRENLSDNTLVIVSNTFTRRWEMEPYLSMLPRKDILILVATGNYQNVHDVPPEAIQAMKERWEPIEGERIVID